MTAATGQPPGPTTAKPSPAHKRRASGQAKRQRLRRGDHEFLPAALQILETPPSPVRLALILWICGLTVAAVTWAYFGRIDIIAAAQGKIQPHGYTKIIQPLETGKVQEVNVENGRKVHAGDVLVTLDASASLADERASTLTAKSYRAEIVRRNAALKAAEAKDGLVAPKLTFDADTPPDIALREQRVLDGDLRQLAASTASLEAQLDVKIADRDRLEQTVASEEKLVATLQQRVDMRSTLVRQSAGSLSNLIDAQETAETQETYLANLKGELQQARQSVQAASADIEKTFATFIADNAQKLADAERQAQDALQKLAKAQVTTSHMTLKSPIDGIVQGLAITTSDQVVTTGQEVMQIVPQHDLLEIECYLPNEDIGFVQTGQIAAVKIQSFPFTRYGTIEAEVEHVAKDAIPEPDAQQREENAAAPVKTVAFGGAQRTQNLVFPLTLTLKKQFMNADGVEVPLVPGMAVVVEIKTGSRRILEYLFSPIVEVASQALKER